MTKQRKLIILALILISVTTAIAWFIVPAFRMYLLYNRLDSEGLTTEARILRTETKANPSFLRILDSYTTKSSMHVEFEDLNGDTYRCILDVSKMLYDEHTVGDFVIVLYLNDDPKQCKLAAYVEGTKDISKIVVISGAVMWLLFVLLPAIIGVLLISRSEDKGEIKLEIGEMRCPECGSQMEEGYIPLISGINWRRQNESVGLLTVFSGLPGTVWWNPFKRPKLPGFHCKRCKVILFKYGKQS